MQELFEDCKRGQTQRVQSWITQKGKKQSRSPLSFLRHGNGSVQPASGWLCGLRQPSTSHTLLHLVALHGHAELARWLVQRDEQLARARDQKGCLAGHLAAWKGHLPVLEVLLGADPDNVNAVDNAKQTALHLATVNGHGQTVRLLLQRNADPRLRNARQENALDIGVRTNRSNICRLLLLHCADLALQCASDCCLSSTHTAIASCMVTPAYPLHIAARLGHADCVQALIEHGFDVNYLNREGTALHSAVRAAQCQIVQILLENGVDVSIKDSEARTALQWLEDKLRGMEKAVNGQNQRQQHEQQRQIGCGRGGQVADDDNDTLINNWMECRRMLLLLAHQQNSLENANGNGVNEEDGKCTSWKRLAPEAKEEKQRRHKTPPSQQLQQKQQQQPVASPRSIFPNLMQPEQQQQSDGANSGRARTISPSNCDDDQSPSTASPPVSAPCPYQPLPDNNQCSAQQNDALNNNSYQNVPKSFYDNAPPKSATTSKKTDHRQWDHNCCSPTPPSSNAATIIGEEDDRKQRQKVCPKEEEKEADDDSRVLMLLHNQLQLPTDFIDGESNNSSLSPCSTLDGEASSVIGGGQTLSSSAHSTAGRHSSTANGNNNTSPTTAATVIYQNAPLAKAEESAASTQPNSPERVSGTESKAAGALGKQSAQGQCHLNQGATTTATVQEAGRHHEVQEPEEEEEEGEIHCLPVDSCNSIATLAASCSSCSLPRISHFSPSPSSSDAAPLCCAMVDQQQAATAAADLLRRAAPSTGLSHHSNQHHKKSLPAASCKLASVKPSLQPSLSAHQSIDTQKQQQRNQQQRIPVVGCSSRPTTTTTTMELQQQRNGREEKNWHKKKTTTSGNGTGRSNDGNAEKDIDNRWKEIDEMLNAFQRDSFYCVGQTQQQSANNAHQQSTTAVPSNDATKAMSKAAATTSASLMSDDDDIANDAMAVSSTANTPNSPLMSNSMFPSSSSFSLIAMPTTTTQKLSAQTQADDADPPTQQQQVLRWLLNDVGLIGENRQSAAGAAASTAQIAQILCSNGFDQIKFMKGALNTKLMSEMGIERKMQLRICRHLNDRSQPEMVPNAATFEFVSDWLNALHLLDHLESFSRANLTSTADLIAANLTRGDLEKMGIVRLGHLAYIMRSLELANKTLLLQSSRLNNKKANGHNSMASSSSSSSTSPGENNTNNSIHIDNSISSSNSIRERKGGGGSGGVGSADSSTTASAPSCARAALLSPQLDMSELRTKLLDSCVQYSAHYLGSTEISNVEGTEDCRRAMVAAKAKVGQSDVPHVIVKISVSGVDILDSNKKAIFHQPINHIQVVCQDELDLNCFAYIFKDGNRHFSHVFCVLTAMIAKEIIVTLGEAFNLAYKLALQQQNAL